MQKTPNQCILKQLRQELKSAIVKKILENSYSTKDLADIMEVSMPAASRYIHGTLTPSDETLCKAIEKTKRLDEELYDTITATIIDILWNTIKKLLKQLKKQNQAKKIEEIADEIAALLYTSRLEAQHEI